MKRFVVAFTVIALSVAALTLEAQSTKALTASGTVKAVSATELKVTAAGKDAKEWTFTVDGTTTFTGKGLGTKAAQAKGKLPATDAVAAGDMVSVTYHDMGGGKMHAAAVRVTSKAKK